MIICPNCKEEIEEQSFYCDQCGQALMYCSNCGRVGTGRRCTYCGGLMEAPGTSHESEQPSRNQSHLCECEGCQQRYFYSRCPDTRYSYAHTIQSFTEHSYSGYQWCHHRAQARSLSADVRWQYVCVKCSCAVDLQARFRLVHYRQAFFKRNEAERS